MAAQESNTNKSVVVMAMDGSDTASRAFEWYRQHLHRQGNYIVFVHCPELHLNVHVLPPFSDLTQLEKEVQQASKRADEMVFDLTQMLHSYKMTGEVKVLLGKKPEEGIVEAAREVQADVIVMGSRGFGTLRRTVLGSVSNYVLHHSDVPVVVCRAKHTV